VKDANFCRIDQQFPRNTRHGIGPAVNVFIRTLPDIAVEKPKCQQNSGEIPPIQD
jgi:hypothetical protein